MRWGLTLLIITVAAILTIQNQEMIGEGWEILRKAEIGWILLSAAAALLSLFAMAEVMRLLFHAAGVRATMWQTTSLTLESNAWSVSVPGGVAFSTALQIKRQMDWGASVVVASWFMLFSGALSTLGLISLAIGSLFFIGQAPAPGMLVLTGVIVLAATALLWWISQNVEVLERIGQWVLRHINKLRKRPAHTDQVALHNLLQQLTSVQLGPAKMGVVFFWSLTNWITDVVCLYAATKAVGADGISMAAVLLAFISGKVAGMIQATPGGVGPVEALLTGMLVAAGLTGSQAFATVVIYRLISLVFVAIIGWILFILGGSQAPDVSKTAQGKSAQR